MITRLAIFLSAFWFSAALAGPLPEAQGQLFLEFARDVSGNDPNVMQTAEALIATPPTTLEGIGFYGLEQAPAPERSLRGIISVLSKAGYIKATEDKYIYEFPLVLMDQGLIDPAGRETALDILHFFGDLDWDSSEKPDWPGFKRFFVKHTEAIEKSVAAKGNHLLSLRLPLGDTLYFWITSPAKAERWRDTALYTGVNTLKYRNSPFTTISLTDPDWESYWGFMTYAMQMPEAYWDVPDGL